jgi:hypothetical protein
MKRIGRIGGVPPLFYVRAAAKGLNLPETDPGASVDSKEVVDARLDSQSSVDSTGVRKAVRGGN